MQSATMIRASAKDERPIAKENGMPRVESIAVPKSWLWTFFGLLIFQLVGFVVSFVRLQNDTGWIKDTMQINQKAIQAQTGRDKSEFDRRFAEQQRQFDKLESDYKTLREKLDAFILRSNGRR